MWFFSGRIAKLESMNRILTESGRRRAERVQELERTLAQRTDRIEELERTVAQRTDRIEELERTVAQRTDRIEELERTLAEQEHRQVSRSRQFDGREIEIIDGLPDWSSRISIEAAGTGTGKPRRSPW